MTETDVWRHRAFAEAQALVYGLPQRTMAFDDVMSLLSIAWLQGFDAGSHQALGEVEQAARQLKAELT